MNPDQLFQIIYNVSLVVVLWATALGLGLYVSVGELLHSVSQTRLMIQGLVLNIVLIPLIVWGLTRVVPMEPGIAIGLVLLGASAGGPFGLVSSRLADGNAVFALALVSILQLTRVIAIPFWLGVVLPFGSADLIQVLVVLFVYIILPVILGMGLKRILAERSDPWERVASRVMVISLAILVISAVLLYQETLAALILSSTTVLILVIQLVSIGLGYLVGGPLPIGRRTLAASGLVRSSATALLFATQVYGAMPLVAPTVILYGVLQIIVSSLAAIAMARTGSRTVNSLI